MSLTVRFDVSQFVSRLEFATKEGLQAIRAGVNAGAVQAKKAFIAAVPPDAAGPGATSGRVRRQTTPINRASVAKLSASFTVKNKGWDASPRIVKMTRGNQFKPGGGTISTFAVTGGGSALNTNSKFFSLVSNGGRVVMVRTGKGKKDLKKIYAEAPATAMAQTNAAPRKAWQATAERELAAQIGARLQLAFNGSSQGDDGGADS